MTWIDDPITLMAGIPPLALILFVFASAAIEYIFPPYPGDMVVLLGFFLAGQGAAPPGQVYLAAVLGGPLGAWCAYHLGRRYGTELIHFISRFRLSLFRRPIRVDRETLGRLFQRFDERWLAVNRFVPVVRSAALFAAGTFRLRLLPTLLYTTLSHVAFMALMLWVGLLTAGSWGEIVASARQVNLRVALVVLVVLMGWGLVVRFRGVVRDGDGV